MEYKPYEYQDFAVEHVIKTKYCGLFLEMGLGKTVSTLTAVDLLMNDYFEVTKVLVIAPLRVADSTWTAEINKWNHLKHLTISKVLGKESIRLEALREKADIYVINRENVPWLVGLYGSRFPFDMVVIDELSSFKSAQAARFKALKQVRPFIKRVVGLTGTPAPNSLIDLWPQLFLLDMGERLGKTISSYRKTYFKPGRTNGQIVFDYRLNKDGENDIYSRIDDICISMKSKDFIDIPERIDNIVQVVFSDKIQKQYDMFEKEMVLSLIDGDINAVNAAALTNKLQQFSNGAIYDENHETKEIHKEKLDILEEIVTAANSKPVLVFYSYKHDIIRIMKRLEAYKPKKLETNEDIDAWNRGEIQVLLAHPQSAGHGLNLQEGGNIAIWFGNTWSLEAYQQANARLHRQGQKQTVIIHHLIAKNTIDEDIMRSLENKAQGQDALMDAVKARVTKYRK